MIGNMKVFTALKARMQWHQARQVVIAENIANANTPGYAAKDLKSPDFREILKDQNSNVIPAGQMKMTSKKHMAGQNVRANGQSAAKEKSDWEVTPSGNSVVLEEQMMKLAENQTDYQTITSLYAKSIKLMKIAVGK